jgi:F-type H+-transporting ATPase subunit epsilon
MAYRSEGDGASVMRLKVLMPEEILFEGDAVKIIAEATDGSFALLPRHIDFIAPLIAGIVLVTKLDGTEAIVGIDEGTLVKCGPEVMISTRRAVLGTDLHTLRTLVDREFRTLDEHEITARTALARLEAGIVRRFIELEDKP